MPKGQKGGVFMTDKKKKAARILSALVLTGLLAGVGGVADANKLHSSSETVSDSVEISGGGNYALAVQGGDSAVDVKYTGETVKVDFTSTGVAGSSWLHNVLLVGGNADTTLSIGEDTTKSVEITSDVSSYYSNNNAYYYCTSVGLRPNGTNNTINTAGESVKVDVISSGQAMGVYNNGGTVNLDGQKVEVNADGYYSWTVYNQGSSAKTVVGSADSDSVKISAKSESGTRAIGTLLLDGSQEEIHGKKIEISAENDSTAWAVDVDNSELTIGDKDSQVSITSTSKNNSMVVWAVAGGKININADTLDIIGTETETDAAMGILAQNNTQTSTPPDGRSSIVINANQTIIKAGGVGIGNFSNGNIEINGGLSVTSDHVLDVRGNSTTTINKAGTGTVVLDGDIVFETPGPKANSGNLLNATIDLTLAGENSKWTGEIYRTYPSDLTEGSEAITTGLTLTLKDGAQWIVTNEIENQNVGSTKKDDPDIVVEKLPVQKLIIEGGVVEDVEEGTTVSVDTLTMSDGEINLDGSTLEINKEANVTGGTITGTLSLADSAKFTLCSGTSISDATISGTIKVSDGTAGISDAMGTIGAVSVAEKDGLELSSAELTITDLTTKGTLTIGSVGSIGTLNAEGGTLNLKDGYTLTNNFNKFDSVNLKGGNLSGNTFNSIGKLTAESGTNAVTKVTGTVNEAAVNSGATLSVTDSDLSTAKAENKGTLTLSGSKLGSLTSSGAVTVSSSSSIGALTMTDGTLAADAELTLTDDGTISGGSVSGILNIASGKTVSLTGGTYTLPALENLSGAGKLALAGSGVISTTAGTIFSEGTTTIFSSDEGGEAALSANAVISDAAAKITFTGGVLQINDEKYTYDYLLSAKDAIAAAEDGSQTTIRMTGTRIYKETSDTDDSGDSDNTETKDEVSADESEQLGEHVIEENTTLKTKNLLVGATLSAAEEAAGKEVEGVTIKKSVSEISGNDTIKVEIENVETDQAGVVITGTKNAQVGGASGGEIVTVVDSNGNVVAGAKAAVVVGVEETTAEGLGLDSEKKGGTLTVGIASDSASKDYRLTGTLLVKEDGTVDITSQTMTVTDGVTLDDGTMNVKQGTLKADVKLTEDTESNVLTGAAEIGTLTGAAGAVLHVGSGDAAGNAAIENATLNGATVFLDPAWKDGVGIEGATLTSIGAGAEGSAEEKTTAIDGVYVVGQNSVLTFGATNDDAVAAFEKTGLTWGKTGVTAALYIGTPVTLDASNGAIVIDGSQEGEKDADTGKTKLPAAFDTPSAGEVRAEANSLLMVDGSTIGEKAAIQSVTSATINDSATLFVDNAEKGKTYKILSGSSFDGAKIGFTNTLIYADNSLLQFVADPTNTTGQYNVKAEHKSVSEAYKNETTPILIADVVENVTKDDTLDSTAISQFFNTVANAHVNPTKASQIAAFNSYAQLSGLAGISHGTQSAARLAYGAVEDHLSLVSHEDNDRDLWAHLIHSKETVRGMNLAGGISANYDLQLNGAVIGSDLLQKGNTTAGVAFTYLDGNLRGRNDVSVTKNDTDYYGVSLYSRTERGNTALLGDISYLHGSHDITQTIGGTAVTADAKSDALSVGITAEHAVKAGAGKIVPYAGLRYLGISTGNYTDSLGMNHDAGSQDLFLLPIGVKYSAEFLHSGWTMRPIAEVGYVWNLGDRDASETDSAAGASNAFGYDTADSGAFLGRLGIEMEKETVVYGISYERLDGDTSDVNKWMVNARFKF